MVVFRATTYTTARMSRTQSGHECNTGFRRVVLEPRGGFLLSQDVGRAHLSLPGATYLLLLDRLSQLHDSVVVTTLVLIGSNLIELILLEITMLAFAIQPEQTPNAIERTKEWIGVHGSEYGAATLAVIGVTLALRGVTPAW
jgi:hypothetical protein